MGYVGVCGPKGIPFQYFICIWLPVNLHQVFGSLLVTMKCDHFDFCVNANKLDYHSDTYEAPIILHDWIREIGGPHVTGLPLCKNPGGRGYLPGYIFAGIYLLTIIHFILVTFGQICNLVTFYLCMYVPYIE